MRTVRRTCGLLALLLYCGALSFGAFVEPLRPGFLDGAHAAVTGALGAVGIYPGMPVFEGSQERELHHRAACVAVIGQTRAGEKRALHAQMQECQAPETRLVVDRWALSHQMLIIEATWDAEGRGAALLRSLADYYCHSSDVGLPLERVSIVSLQDRVDREGRLDRRAFLHLHYLCREQRAAPQPWPTVAEVLP